MTSPAQPTAATITEYVLTIIPTTPTPTSAGTHTITTMAPVAQAPATTAHHHPAIAAIAVRKGTTLAITQQLMLAPLLEVLWGV